MVGNTNVSHLGQFWDWTTIKSSIEQPAQILTCETPYSYCLFCIGIPLVLHKKCIGFSDPHFRDIAAPKNGPRFNGKMTFHKRFSPTAPGMSGADRKLYERS